MEKICKNPQKTTIMNITHYVVTAKVYDDMLEVIALDHTPLPEDYPAIPVDLSEEGIKTKAYESAKIQLVQIRGNESIDMGYEFSHDHYEGYKQCAKDLLNTKP